MTVADEAPPPLATGLLEVEPVTLVLDDPHAITDHKAAASREARRRSDPASVKPGYRWAMNSAVPVTRSTA